MEFSDLALRHLDTPGYFWDDKIKGFGIRIGKRAKTFLCVREGVRTTIGRYPLQISLSDARKQAVQLLYSPKVKSPASEAHRVSTVISAYLRAIDVRPNTWRYYEQFLKRLDAKHGTKNLDEITPRMCAEMITSPHMHLVFKVFFKWLKGQAYITTNPMADIEAVGKFKKRKRVLTDEELKKVWSASLQLGHYGATIRLIILLAARRSEIGTAKVEGEYVIFPATKNSLDHKLPVTPYMKAEFSKVKPIINWSKSKVLLDKAGIPEFQLRDLRRTTATNLCRPEIKTDPFLVERLLNHSLPTLMQIYNQTDWTEQMRSPLEKHERWLLEMVK